MRFTFISGQAVINDERPYLSKEYEYLKHAAPNINGLDSRHTLKYHNLCLSR